jgi:CBS domain-containing protein
LERLGARLGRILWGQKEEGTMPEPTATTRQKTQNRLEELRRLSDEIRNDLRRATLELRNEWKELERRLPDPSTAAEQLRGATADMADRLVDELRKFRSRLQPGATEGGSIADLMSKPVVACHVADPLARAVTMMWERDVGFVPVLDHEQRIVGTLTDRDAAIAACTRGQRFDEIPVDTVMSKEVVTCPPSASPAQVLAVMKERQIRRVPVAEDGRPVGIVTINDLLRGCARADRGSLSAKEIVEALASIARPRQPNGNQPA